MKLAHSLCKEKEKKIIHRVSPVFLANGSSSVLEIDMAE